MFMEYVHDIVKCKKSYGKVRLVWFQFCKYILPISPPQKIGRMFTKIERMVISENYNYKLFLFYFLICPYPLKFKKRIF